MKLVATLLKCPLQKWIKETNDIEIISKSGRHDAETFTEPDIAFEFASWLSPEFKLCVIQGFQRLKNNKSFNNLEYIENKANSKQKLPM